jgi:hypothetical protein
MEVETGVQRTKCVIVWPAGHDRAFIRIDYLNGLMLCAREWVSVNGLEEIGLKGSAWWRERFGFVPDHEKQALKLASELQVPERLVLKYETDTMVILKYVYVDKVLDGWNSLFFQDQNKNDLRLALSAPEIRSRWSESKATPSWWNLTKLRTTGKPYRRLANPFCRSSLTFDDREFLRSVLEISRESFVDPRHLNATQAAKNLSMAFSLGVPAHPEEINPFFSLIISINDFVRRDHRGALMSKLSSKLNDFWLEKLVSPRLTVINSYPDEDRPTISRMLGISPSGAIESGMWWSSHGYYRGDVSVPSIGVEQIFANDPLQNPTSEAKKIQNHHGIISFFDLMKETLRDCINEVRVDLGVPKIGEGWINETLLFYRLKELIGDRQVIHHGKPKWLGRQHFDIWIPDLNVAVEYHGEQHFVANAFFGGEAAFRKNVERDERKRALSKANGVRLVEVRFDEPVTNEELLQLVLEKIAI